MTEVGNYSHIHHPREIADRKRLGALLAASPDPSAQTTQLILFLKQGEEEIVRRFQNSRDLAAGRIAARERAFLIDQIIRTLYDIASEHLFPNRNPSMGEHLSLIAIGGYGRGELAPFSDIDLLFIQGYRHNPWAEKIVEFLLYRLWDLGLKPGYAVRTLDEAIRWAKKDMHALTSLLEARPLVGEEICFFELRKRVHQELLEGQEALFAQRKIEERDGRHAKFGQSRYSLEPNIKEGKGGLRDLHLLRWLAIVTKNAKSAEAMNRAGLLSDREKLQFERAENVLWLLRIHLHLLANRAEERMSFDLQPELALRLQLAARPGLKPVERMMRMYFRNARMVGRLSDTVLAQILRGSPTQKEEEFQGFRLSDGRLSTRDPLQFKHQPIDLLRIFALAQNFGLSIHPQTMNEARQLAPALLTAAFRKEESTNRLFLQILTSARAPEEWLRRLNEAGIFGRFIPEFGRIIDQVQFDMYHHFTVDEHTIRAIGELDQLLKGELAKEVPELAYVGERYREDRQPLLFLAVLLHDIAKGRDRDHSVVGAEIALEMGPRFGLSPADTETMAWLVRYHLLMSNTAFRRNLDDPKTLKDFVAQVESRERLGLLLLLTIADIRAVGPRTWNSWKARLLRDLYLRAEEVLSPSSSSVGRENRLADLRQGLEQALSEKGWSKTEIEAHLSHASPGYLLGFPKEELVEHALFLKTLKKNNQDWAVHFTLDPQRDVTHVLVAAQDRPGLVAHLAGAFALSGANIVDARIFTLSDNMALDTFSLQDAIGEPIHPERLARLQTTMRHVLEHPQEELSRLSDLPAYRSPVLQVFPLAPRVRIETDASDDFTVIEISTRDRRGLVYQIADLLWKLGCTIGNAKVATFGHRAVDVFYVKGPDGRKITDAGLIENIRLSLLDLLTREDHSFRKKGALA